MRTIQFKIEDHYLQTILTILKNLKLEIKDLIVTKDNQPDVDTDVIQKLHEARGILRHRIKDPVAYQRKLRSEWERE